MFLVIILHIHKGYFHVHDTLPLHGETCSAIDEQTKTGSNKLHLQLTQMWGGEKRSDVKSENLKYNPCWELSSQGYVEWSMVRQNPAVDALSNPSTQ